MVTRPIPNTVPAFDATSAFTFTFTSIGGDQVVKNKITIRNQTTNAIVYENTQITYQFINTVPANTLANGTYYNYTIITYDVNNNASQESIAAPFYCYSTPTLSITNMPSGNLISNSSYSFEFTYNQTEGELLNYYIVNLYDGTTNTLLSTSGEKYTTSTTLPLNLSYLLSGFNDLGSYSIEISGITVNNTQITTGKISFTVKYTKPNMFSVIELTNNCQGGYISFKSNVVILNGTSNPSPPIYIQDKEVDLTANNSWVQWTDGIDISGDFTIGLWGRKFNTDSNIFTMFNQDGETISINYKKGYSLGSSTFQVYADVMINGYYIFSNYIDIPLDTEQIFIWVRRINNIYQVKIENKGAI